MIDGFKTTQRKVLYTLLKQNQTTGIKVVQAASRIAEETLYLHGEVSLVETVVGMAQDHVGIQNIALLDPMGQFGSRLDKAKVHAAGRYIMTRLDPIARILFPKLDDAVLTYLREEGQQVEPEQLVPILPLLLVNSNFGIGSGYSCSVPCFHPLHVLQATRSWIRGESLPELAPWYHGFTGEIVPVAGKTGTWITSGTCVIDADQGVVDITELGVGSWTNPYIEWLKGLDWVTRIDNYCTDTRVHIRVHVDTLVMPLEKVKAQLKLTSTINTTNMTCFDAAGKVKRFATVHAIIDAFCVQRLQLYEKRKNHLLAELARRIEILTQKVRFIRMRVNGELVVEKLSKGAVETLLHARGFSLLSTSSSGIGIPSHVSADGTSGTSDIPTDTGSGTYDYLMGMSQWSLTEEHVVKLERECDLAVRQRAELQDCTERQLWLSDLDVFEMEYGKYVTRKRQLAEQDTSGKKRESTTIGTTASQAKKKQK